MPWLELSNPLKINKKHRFIMVLRAGLLLRLSNIYVHILTFYLICFDILFCHSEHVL